MQQFLKKTDKEKIKEMPKKAKSKVCLVEFENKRRLSDAEEDTTRCVPKKAKSKAIQEELQPKGHLSITEAENTPDLSAPIDIQQKMLSKLRHVATALSQVQSNVVTLTEKVEILQKTLDGMGNRLEGATLSTGSPTVSLTEFYCDSVDKLRELDNRIKDEEDFRKSLCHCIWARINKQLSIQRIIGNILKGLVHPHVLQNFTAQKDTKSKSKFVDFELWTCIRDTIMDDFNKSEMKIRRHQVELGLSKAFNNSKDWKILNM